MFQAKVLLETNYFSKFKVKLLKEFTCCLCGGKESAVSFSAFDFDESVESFELLKCTSCGLAQTWPLPDPKSIDRHYSNFYYGSGSKKFSGLVEYLTVLGNKLRAKKIKKNRRKNQD